MLKVFEAFAGYGSQTLALKYAGIEHEVIGISEIDKYAIQAYEQLHGEVKNYGDISKVDVTELPQFELFTYSFPCFAAGTKVLTLSGYKNIEHINAGDLVMTHLNRFEKVVKPMVNKADHLYEVNTMVSDTLFTTSEHPFYARKKSRVWDNSLRRYVRVFADAEWVETRNLDGSYYVGTPINTVECLPTWVGIKDGRSETLISNRLSDKFTDVDFWWLIGRYLGDGWLRKQCGIVISSNRNTTHEIAERLERLQFNYSLAKERTADKVHIAFKEIGAYVEQFGRGAANKRLTSDVLNLPKHLLEGFLDGYISADGHTTPKGVVKVSSVSNELIYGIGQCVAKVYNRPFSVYKTIRSATHVIEGRTVNQKPSYQLNFKKVGDKQDRAFYDNGYIWSPLHNVKKIAYDGLVYNMEVENDNSYVVQNIIVHNCTDLSVAGRQEGLHGGTRSGLLYECNKIIEYVKPKYLLMENVKALVQKKFKSDFDAYLAYLESLGYTNYWRVLNAKDFGVPQNRERVFVVSILGEHEPYQFPTIQDLHLRIKDILEPNVVGYDLSDKVQERFKEYVGKQNIVGTTAPPFRTIGQRDEVYSTEGVMGCLVATDYKQPKQILIIDDTQGFEAEPHIYDTYSPTLRASRSGLKTVQNYKVRKLTPRECWRLMGVKDTDFNKLGGISDTQLYKLAGNSIVANVLEKIFLNLFK